MTIDELTKLITLLKTSNIASFDDGNTKLTFHVEQRPIEPIAPPDLIEDTKAEESLPLDLRTDNINSYDSVMNWSAPPSADEKPLPLTGDEQL